MTSNTSMYSTPPNQDVSSTNSTSLYGGADTPIPDSSGNVVVRGDLYVLSGNILTTATTGNIFPANATTINLGLAATAVNIGAGSGTTTINNDLAVDGDANISGDLTIGGTFIAPGADFGNITIAVADDNTITTTTGNLKLDSATNIVNVNASATISGTTNMTGALYADGGITTTGGNLILDADSGIINTPDIQALNAGGLNLYSNNALHALHLYDTYVQITSGTGPGADWVFNPDGSTDFPYYKFPSADGTANQVLKTDGSGLLSWYTPTDLNTTYTIDASTTTGGANFNLVGSDATTDTIKFASGTGVTVSRTNANEIGVAIGQDVATTSNVTFADITATNDLTVQGNNVNLAQATIIGYNENNNRANRPEVQSTTGNSSGWRVIAPNATTASNSNLTVFNTNDINNGSFVSVQAIGSTTAPFNVRTGTYSGGVLSSSNKVISFVDGTTTYATLNPAGPTNSTDLATKSYVDSHEANTTYTIDASTTTGGANFNLVGSDATTDTIKFAGSGGTTVTRTDANTITIDSSATTDRLTNGTYTFILDASGYLSTENSGSYNPTVIKGGGTNQTSITVADGSVTTTMSDGFALSSTTLTQDTDKLSFAHVAGTVVGAQNGTWSYNLDGTTSFPNYKFPYADGTSNQVLRTNGSGVLSWYTPVDTNTTYTYAAGSVSGGANLTLTGSDSSTNTIKLTNGGHITAAYTSGTAVTLGSDATDANTASTIVARDASGNFSAGTGTFTGVKVAGATSGSSTFTAPATGSTLSYVLPGSSGAANTVLTNDGSGNLSWALPGGGGSTFGNVSIGVDTDQTISTTSGNLILQTAAGVNAGTITLAAGANGNITISPNGTGVVSTGVAQLATGSRTLGQHLGTQSTTWTPPASGLTNLTSQNGFFASSSSGGANGASSVFQTRYYSGDTTAGTNISASFLGGGATGTNSSPAALANGQVLMSLNADGYATTGWASTIATGTQTPTGIPIMPAQLQFYSREAFADNGTNVTAGGTGMRVRLFNAATTLTAANRVSIIDHTTTTATYKAVTFNIQPAATTANMLTLGATTGSINQDTFTIKNNAATTTYATFNSTSATLNGDTTAIKNTAGTTTYASFASGGASLGYVDAPVLFDRTTAGTPGVANQKNAFIIESRRSDQTGVTDTDSTGNNFRVGGTSNYYWTNQIQSYYKTSGDHTYTLQAAAGDQTSTTPSWLNLATFAPTQTVISAGTAGSGGSTSAKLTVDANKITHAVPVVFPSYTKAQANALTGAVGWQIAISDSASGGNPNGMMAFWDTTNARWSYIHDNSAV